MICPKCVQDIDLSQTINLRGGIPQHGVCPPVAPLQEPETAAPPNWPDANTSRTMTREERREFDASAWSDVQPLEPAVAVPSGESPPTFHSTPPAPDFEGLLGAICESARRQDRNHHAAQLVEDNCALLRAYVSSLRQQRDDATEAAERYRMGLDEIQAKGFEWATAYLSKPRLSQRFADLATTAVLALHPCTEDDEMDCRSYPQ